MASVVNLLAVNGDPSSSCIEKELFNYELSFGSFFGSFNCLFTALNIVKAEAGCLGELSLNICKGRDCCIKI